MSENLYLRMWMLKCDLPQWLSDKPPEMLELLYATKNKHGGDVMIDTIVCMNHEPS